MVPYTYDANDFKFYIAPGFASSMAYYEHIKNSFGVYTSTYYIFTQKMTFVRIQTLSMRKGKTVNLHL